MENSSRESEAIENADLIIALTKVKKDREREDRHERRNREVQ